MNSLYFSLYVTVFLLSNVFNTICLLSASVITALKYEGGIIIGSDSISIKHGSMVSNRNVKNVFLISDGIALCDVSGGDDFESLCTHLTKVLLSQIYNSHRPLTCTSVAKFARILIHSQYRGAHVLVLGCDESFNIKMSHDYSIHEILPGGSLMNHDEAVVVGHGSSSVRGLLESMLEELHNAEKARLSPPAPAQARIDVTRRVLRSAMSHDARCGGRARVWVLTARGLKLVQDKTLVS